MIDQKYGFGDVIDLPESNEFADAVTLVAQAIERRCAAIVDNAFKLDGAFTAESPDYSKAKDYARAAHLVRALIEEEASSKDSRPSS